MELSEKIRLGLAVVQLGLAVLELIAFFIG